MGKMKVIGLSFSVMIFSFLLLTMIVDKHYISGDCMEPAIRDGSFCYLNKLSPYLRLYKINDIILFTHQGKTWISRIVALENNTILLNEGKAVVDGIDLLENGIHRDWSNWRYGNYAIDKPFKVPSGHVYVLSDKLSAHHDDSRVFGPISISSILGVIW